MKLPKDHFYSHKMDFVGDQEYHFEEAFRRPIFLDLIFLIKTLYLKTFTFIIFLLFVFLNHTLALYLTALYWVCPFWGAGFTFWGLSFGKPNCFLSFLWSKILVLVKKTKPNLNGLAYMKLANLNWIYSIKPYYLGMGKFIRPITRLFVSSRLWLLLVAFNGGSLIPNNLDFL